MARDERGSTVAGGSGTPCTAVRADGQPCGGTALPGRDVCFAHADDLDTARKAGNGQGGRNSANTVRAQRLLPRDLKPVLHLAIKALQEVHDGAITPAQGSSMAALIGAVSKLFGVVELEEQVRELENRHGIAE